MSKINLMYLYTNATLLAMNNNQVVGKNRDYYITLEQLEKLFKDYEEIK